MMSRGHGLKLSLLVSLGLVPISCGGAMRSGSAEGGAGGSNPVEPGNGGRGGRGTTDPHGSAGSSIVTGGSGFGGFINGHAGTAGMGPVPCSSPKLDERSGLVFCAEGYAHRPAVTFCDAVGGAPAEVGGAGGDSSDLPKPRATDDVECESDRDCQAYELGYCGGDGFVSVCQSGCLADADCGPFSICVCSGYTGHGGQCQPSHCKTDGDCGSGSLCGSYSGVCGSDGFACFTSRDQCRTSADCNGGSCDYELLPQAPGSSGGAIATHGRVCDDAVCGRPFLVQDQARVAPVQRSADWCSAPQPRPELASLTGAERAGLAQHWIRMGQMEHASIAAFARFSLQLLALGAPPELVEGSTRALADETEHTKLCFALASAYSGRALGPAELDVEGSLLPTSLAEVVSLVIAEGCFGETSAALEALEAADAATDPVIVDAYLRIARDEQRHAELAFRFVRWALEQQPQLAELIRKAIVAERAVSAAAQDVVETCLYGVLTRRQAA